MRDLLGKILHAITAASGGQLSKELLAQQGITPGMIRLAIGIENTQDLIADLDSGLKGL